MAAASPPTRACWPIANWTTCSTLCSAFTVRSSGVLRPSAPELLLNCYRRRLSLERDRPVRRPSGECRLRGYEAMPPVIIGPPCNRRVTCGSSPGNDRTETALSINPTNPDQMLASSKRFTDPHPYALSLAAYLSP